MTDKEANREELAKAVKDVLKDKESAKKFLLSTGIMDADGRLAEPYRTEETASNNFCEMADKYYKDVLIGECQMEESMAGHCRLSYYQGLKDGAQTDKKEPVSDDLEEEIKRWVYDPCFDLNGVAVKGATDYLTVEDVADIARHFANWQKQQMEFERGYRKALEDAWEFFGKGFPNDCRILVKQFFDKEMEQKLKELSQG